MIDNTEQRDYRRMLLQLVATVLVGSALVQLVIALADHRITWLTYLALAVTAVAYAWRTYDGRTLMRRTRYGAYRPHALAFLIVVGAFYLHAAYLLVSDQSDLIDANWKGLLFGMGIFWGLGLAVHTVGTVVTKGFEDVEI